MTAPTTARGKIRNALAAAQLTPWAAAEMMDGVSHQCLRNLVSGQTYAWNVKVNTAFEIARLLPGIEIDDFRRPEGAPL